MGSLGSGRPSIFGACESGLVVVGHPVLGRSGEEFLVIRQDERSSGTSGRLLFTWEGIASKLLGFERLSSLFEGEREMSKLTLRPEAGDVVEVKKCGDSDFPSRLIVVTGGNRDLVAEVGWAEPLGSSFWPLPAKSKLRVPALNVLGAPPLRGEDLDRGLGDTELDDSSCSGERSDITSAGCERYGFG